jgi:phosphonopyruvate decarboxylase
MSAGGSADGVNEARGSLTVAEACAALGEVRGDSLAVLTMSAIGFWPDPREEDYRLMGLMGGAGSIGLGLALGRPERPVWVLDGDGSLLMSLGVLAAVGDAAPANLVHIVFENRIYAISGGQPSPGGVDWAGLFLAAGYRAALVCLTGDDVRAVADHAGEGPLGVVIRCESRRPEYPPGAFAISPAQEAERVHAALAG